MIMAKPASKKKTASSAPKKKPQASSTASHPPYFQMIKEAILALRERNGSSPHAIAKYMEEKHRGMLPDNYRKLLARQLKNLTDKGKLVKVKFSFKLSPYEKLVAKKVEKAAKPVSVQAKRKTPVAAKKPSVVAAKKRSAPAKSAKKKPVGKKVKMAAPVKHKQPKSIKSPAAKRARKASA